MVNIVVDDERTFKEPLHAIYCRTSDDALKVLVKLWTNQQKTRAADTIHQLWLDHDLGEDDTIQPVVDFLYVVGYLRAPLIVDEILVHSMNPVAKGSVPLILSKYYRVRSVTLPTVISVTPGEL